MRLVYRKILFVAALLLQLNASAQQFSVLLDDLLNPTKNELLQMFKAEAQKVDGKFVANIYTLTGKQYAKGSFYDRQLNSTNGLFLFYDTIGGALVQEINMSYDIAHGLYKSYHVNGKLKDSGMFYYGMPKGKWVSYHENGSLYFSAKYVDSFATPKSVYNSYHFSEKPSVISRYLRSYFDASTKIGLWQTYFDNGQKSDSIVYDLGEKNGLAKSWYRNGQLESIGSYNADTAIGSWSWFYSNGKRCTEETYVKGKIAALKCYDTSGVFIGENCGVNRDAYYPGGEKGITQFFNDAIWPLVDTVFKEKGLLVKLVLNIDYKGEAVNIDIHPKNAMLKQQLNNKIKQMRKWQPAISHNRFVTALILYERFYDGPSNEDDY